MFGAGPALKSTAAGAGAQARIANAAPNNEARLMHLDFMVIAPPSFPRCRSGSSTYVLIQSGNLMGSQSEKRYRPHRLNKESKSIKARRGNSNARRNGDRCCHLGCKAAAAVPDLSAFLHFPLMVGVGMRGPIALNGDIDPQGNDDRRPSF